MFQSLGMPASAGVGEMQGLRAACNTGRCDLPEDLHRARIMPPIGFQVRIDGLTGRLFYRVAPAEIEGPVGRDLAEKLQARLSECLCAVFNETGAIPFDEEGINTVILAFKEVLNTLYTQQNGGLNNG